MTDRSARRFMLLRVYSHAAAMAAAGVGYLVLVAWAFQFESLKTVLPGLVAMKVNTAVGLIFSGTSLLLLLPTTGTSGIRRFAGHFLAVLVILIGAGTLSQYLFGVELGIDEFLFTETSSLATSSPGRMAPTTATAFLTLGLGLLLLEWETRGHRPAQVLSLWAGLVALAALSGHLYGATAFYRLSLYTDIALHTAVTLFALSVAIFFARPRSGIAGDLTGGLLGSVMARRFLPAVLVVPIGLGWICLRGQRAGYYGPEMAVALFATFSVISFAMLVWLNSRKMNTADARRGSAETGLRELNADLERRIELRTQTLEHQKIILSEQSDLLGRAKEELELEVTERTAQLASANAQLEYQLLVRGEAEDALRRSQAELEARVAIRTVELRRANARLSDVLDAATLISIIATDRQGLITMFNSGAERMLGYAASEMVGKRTPAAFHVESELEARRIRLSELFWRPVAGFGIFVELARIGPYGEREWTYVRKDNSQLMISLAITAVEDTEGDTTGFLFIANDITQRKQTESKLRVLTERLSLATSVAAMGVWDWELASNSLTWDATMAELYGFTPTVPLLYAQWSGAVLPEDLPAAETELQRVIGEKGRGSTEFRITRPDGTVRHIAAVQGVVLDEHDNVSRVIGVNVDVTAQKKAEALSEHSRQDQLRFKDEFLSHVSHELRSPLTAIKQFTSILLGGLAGELNAEQRQYQQIVLRNSRQLQSMIDDLLEVTRLETGKLGVIAESVSVTAAIADTNDTIRETARAKGITLSMDVLPDLPAAYADPIRLRQILIILSENAVKFTPEGGEVKIRARRFDADPQFLLLEVSDTGCGIRPERTEQIFERLYQVSGASKSGREGLGLGLYICKELVLRQGGRIWVRSQPEQGSTFSLTLPVFSLDRLIAPLVTQEKRTNKSVALVIVEMRSRDGWLSREAREDWSQEARSVIRQCMLPDLDVLLPKMGSAGDEEMFFVAASADEQGAAVLVNRIREQLARVERLQQGGLTISVSSRMLGPFTDEAAATTEHLVRSIVSSIEEHVCSPTHSRT